MGRKPGYHHSEATKARIAESVRKAAPQAGVSTTAPQPVSLPQSAVAAPRDALDALAVGPVKDVIALMLWKNRHNEPELSVQLTEHDLSGFRACVDYLHVTPEVRIVRPQGLPGHDVIPATRTRSAIPAAEPTPPKPYVTVCLVERGTENAIRPVENNEQDWAAAEEAKNFNRARDVALRLAGELQQAAATGNYSSSSLDEAAKCLVALAR